MPKGKSQGMMGKFFLPTTFFVLMGSMRQKTPHESKDFMDETACHEAAHAVTCILEKRHIFSWSIVSQGNISRLNRRLRKKIDIFYDPNDCGEINYEHSDQKPPVILSLSGFAGEGYERLFEDEDGITSETVMEICGDDSDEFCAWVETQKLGKNLYDILPNDKTVIACLNEVQE